MSNFINVFVYLAIGFSVMQNYLALTFLLVAFFTFRCGAVWLIPLAIVIDAYFGAFYSWPVFSLLACGWYAISELVRPQLIIQPNSYEKA